MLMQLDKFKRATAIHPNPVRKVTEPIPAQTVSLACDVESLALPEPVIYCLGGRRVSDILPPVAHQLGQRWHRVPHVLFNRPSPGLDFFLALTSLTASPLSSLLASIGRTSVGKSQAIPPKYICRSNPSYCGSYSCKLYRERHTFGLSNIEYENNENGCH